MPRLPTVTVTPPPPARYERAYAARRARDASLLERFFNSIRAHWRIFAGVFFVCVALGTIGTLLYPKQYTATVQMIVGNDQMSTGAAQNNSFVLNSDTIADLIQDGTVVGKVIDTLKLSDNRAQLLGRVHVALVPNTPIINLSARAQSPAQAAAVANTFAGVFIDRDRELVGAQAVAAQNYLATAIAKAQTTLQQADAALSAYEARYQIADPTQTQPLLARAEATESKLEELQDDREQAQAQLASAQTQMATLPPTIAGQQATDVNPATTELQQQLAETQMQLATARQRYTNKYPAVVALEEQQRALQRQLAAEPGTVAGQVVAVPNPVYQQLSQQAATLRSQIQGDIVQISELQRRRAALAPAIAALPAQTTQLGMLQEREKLASDVDKALEQKYDEAVVAANSAISDVSVVQPADPGNVTVSPNLALNIAASIIIGLIAGLLAVAVASATQRRIREDGDVERVLGLPVIAHIPSLTQHSERALPWLQTATLEGFLHLCASLRILGRKSGTHVIVITSPEKGDGKTTIAYYLASAMSRVRSRVLLIDGDMRCPATHLHAKIENGPGLSEVLSGQRSFDQVVVHASDTLDVLTAGALPPNPVALAESEAFDDLLALARERYNCIIIDTPALAPVVDSAVIATRADSTAVVLSANSSNQEAAGQAVARLRSLGIDNILGVIMNRTKTRFSDYSDYFVSAPRALPS